MNVNAALRSFVRSFGRSLTVSQSVSQSLSLKADRVNATHSIRRQSAQRPQRRSSLSRTVTRFQRA